MSIPFIVTGGEPAKPVMTGIYKGIPIELADAIDSGAISLDDVINRGWRIKCHCCLSVGTAIYYPREAFIPARAPARASAPSAVVTKSIYSDFFVRKKSLAEFFLDSH